MKANIKTIILAALSSLITFWFYDTFIAKPTSIITVLPATMKDYQIECCETGLELWDGSKYIGFVQWNGKETPLDSLIFEDNK